MRLPRLLLLIALGCGLLPMGGAQAPTPALPPAAAMPAHTPASISAAPPSPVAPPPAAAPLVTAPAAATPVPPAAVVPLTTPAEAPVATPAPAPARPAPAAAPVAPAAAAIPAAETAPLFSSDPATRRRGMLDLAQRAEMAFRKGDFGGARLRYEQLAELAPHDFDVLYNLAVAHARLGERGPALWRLLQAQKLEPRDADLRQQLRALAYELPAISPLPVVNGLYPLLTGNEWALLAALGTGLGLLGLALGLWLPPGHGWRARLRSAAWWPLALGLAAWPFAVTHYYQEQLIARAVIVAEHAVARTGPDEQTIETFALPAGTVVRVQGLPENQWLKISFAGGRKGYVKQAELRYL